MSKKILEVDGSATRDARDYSSGSFHSAHKPEDIEKWLKHKGVDDWTDSFDEVFGVNWDWYSSDDKTDTFDVQFTETEDEDECEFDDEIQKFIDEEYIKNKEKNK